MHTPAGDRWREGLRRPDGSLAGRIQDIETERMFWQKRMEKGTTRIDAYSKCVFRELVSIVGDMPVQSVIEIGPGWEIILFPWLNVLKS